MKKGLYFQIKSDINMTYGSHIITYLYSKI